MRLSSIFLALASTTSLSVAQVNNSDCTTTNKEKNGPDFQFTEGADNTYLPKLAAIFKAAGRNVTAADVWNDGNHYLKQDASGIAWTWEKKTDYNDQDVEKWLPQGISSTADMWDVGTHEGINGWVVSWYQNNVSVRITFVNRADLSYRNAILVNPISNDNYEAVKIHAGGIMLYGNTLWVVDSTDGGRGIRVFDLTNIWRVDTGSGYGKKADGGYSAGDYRYVIPQLRLVSLCRDWKTVEYLLTLTSTPRHYKWTSSFFFRFSFMALDRTTTPDSLIVGEYQPANNENLPTRFARFDLDYTTRKLRTTNKIAKAVWAYCVNIDRMQGAVSANGKFYISRSNGNTSRGDMFGWVPGQLAVNNAGLFPPGPEDLSYDKRNNRVYGLTEHPGSTRVIMSIDAGAIRM